MAQLRRNGPYAPLSAHYPRDDAILELESAGDETGLLAEVLFARSLALCAADTRLDGFISALLLRTGRVYNRPPAKLTKAAERLVSVGLWIAEDGGYRIRSWAKWNRTHDEIQEKRGYDNSRKGALTKAVRAEVYARDNHMCVWCGSTENLSIDHVIPLSAGGTHDLDNLQTLCKPCNSKKGARQPKDPNTPPEDRKRAAEEAQSERGFTPESPPTDPGIADRASIQRNATQDSSSADASADASHGSPTEDGPSASSNETREAKPEGPSPDTTSINPPTDYTPHHVAWTLDELVAQIHEMRPGWKPVLIRNPVRRMLDKGISLERVALAAYAVASDPTSKFPIRLTEDGWWWDEHDTRRQQSDATITAGVAA